MKAFVSLRVSTSRQEREGVSLGKGPEDPGIQEQKCRELCQLRNWEVAGVYRDAASGRKIKDRDGLAQAARDAMEAQGMLVFYSVSRCGRNLRDILNLVHDIQEAGANIASATEQIDTSTAMGKAFFHLTAVFAELESDQISERVKHTHAYMRNKHGFNPISKPRYGWEHVTIRDANGRVVTHERVRVPAEQAIIARLLELRRSGHSTTETAAVLNAEGHPAPSGGPWNRGTVSRIHCQQPGHRKLRRAKRVRVLTPEPIEFPKQRKLV
jgi:site-specific DNA recombinase